MRSLRSEVTCAWNAYRGACVRAEMRGVCVRCVCRGAQVGVFVCAGGGLASVCQFMRTTCL